MCVFIILYSDWGGGAFHVQKKKKWKAPNRDKNSQGAALTHRAVEAVPQYVKDRITGVVTFGDTQTLQDGGRIRGYPVERTLIICNTGDVICAGYMWVVPVHFYYMQRVPEGLAFLIARILMST